MLILLLTGLLMPADTSRPDDLIPTREAAALVDRSQSTIRAWLRAGKLTKHREQPGQPSSRALVSRAELLCFAAGELDPNPPRAGSAPAAPASSPLVVDTPNGEGAAVELAQLRAELAGSRAVLEATRAHVASLEAQLRSVGDRVEAQLQAERRRADLMETRALELRADLQLERERLQAACAERDALRAQQGIGWLRRLLPGPVRLVGEG